MHDHDAKHLVSQTGAAKMLGLSPSTVRNLISQGTLRPVLTRDGARLLTVAEVERYGRERRKRGRPRRDAEMNQPD